MNMKVVWLGIFITAFGFILFLNLIIMAAGIITIAIGSLIESPTDQRQSDQRPT